MYYSYSPQRLTKSNKVNVSLRIILILLLGTLKVGFTQAQSNEILLLDDFNDGDYINKFGTISGTFGSIPPNNPTTGTCIAKIYNENVNNIRGKTGFSLELTYDVSNPESFSGYFSKLAGKDLSEYKYLSFWVKGEEGGEFFKIELKNNSSNNNRNKASVYITDYLDGSVTTTWQKVVIPLDAFCNLDTLTNMSEFVLVFENYQSTENGSPLTGTIYIDDILFVTYFIGCVRIDHYGDKLGKIALGGDMGDMDSDGPSKTYTISTSTCHNAPNSLLSEYDVTSGWAGVFKIFGGGEDGWTAQPYDFSAYDKLSLWVKAKAENENPKEMKLELKGTNTTGFVKISGITSDWQNFSLPIANFGIDKTSIQQLNYIYEDWRVENKIGGVYIDDVQFEKEGYTPDTTPPPSPLNLTANGSPITNGFVLGGKNLLTSSIGIDETLESVRFEYSVDNSTWYTIGTDYNLSDDIQITWYTSNLNSEITYSIRAIAQDASGNETISEVFHNLKIEIGEGVRYIVDNFNDQNYLNDFCGNWGELNGDFITATFTTTVYHGTKGAGLKIDYNLSPDTYTGIGHSLFGHSDFPQYSISFKDIYGPLNSPEEQNKAFDYLIFWVRGSGQTNNTYLIKVELKDNRLPKDERYNYTALRYISIDDSKTDWMPIVLDADVGNSNFWSYNKYPPDSNHMKELVLVIEEKNNPASGSFYIDDIYFVDEDKIPFESDIYTNDEFLEFISRRTFKYFLDWAEPNSGLILDKSTLPELITTAGCGFGLSALCIGAERGWISYEEAEKRVKTILTTLYNGKQGPETSGCIGYKGFYYHFLGTDSTRKDTGSELSSIDTAILMAGVLTAKEYFKNNLDIVQTADYLYRNVEWGWMLNPTTGRFFMAWKPEEGFSQWQWDYYTDEAILLCLLAIASPTHPVNHETFYNWQREWGTYSNYSLIQSYHGPLFTYFFANCWCKFKGLGKDNHPTTPIDWWENSVKAAKANWQYCKDKGYEGWGLTACEGPDESYYAYGSLPCAEPNGQVDDGTLAPYGVGLAIPGFPDEAISTLKYYYKNTDLFRELFGFGDAYNPHSSTVTIQYNGPWYNHSYFAIDQGPMLMMIENYRSELIWKYFMQNEYIKRGLSKIFPNHPPRLATVTVYPNPFVPSKGHRVIKFGDPVDIEKRLTKQATIKIFTIAGELVKTIREPDDDGVSDGIAEWDARNDAGEKVASGIYIYLVTNAAGEKVTGKIGIIR